MSSTILEARGDLGLMQSSMKCICITYIYVATKILIIFYMYIESIYFDMLLCVYFMNGRQHESRKKIIHCVLLPYSFAANQPRGAG